MATFENRSVVVSDTEGNNAAVTPAGELKVDGSGVTQPISAVSLPLPAGAATEATLVSVESDTASIDASTSSLDTKFDATLSTLLNTLGQKNMAGSAPVVIASNQSPVPVSGTVTANNDSVGENGVGAPLFSTQVGGPDSDGNLDSPRVLTSAPGAGDPGFVVRNVPSGTQAVSAVSLPLPTGAATEATLATRAAASQLPAALVGGRLDENVGAWLGSTAPTVGQKAMAASLPVTLASDQSAVPISAASLPLPTGAATAALQTQPGVDIGDVTVNNGAGAAAVNIQDGGNSITVDGTVAVSGSVAVTGPLTDAQLRASAVPISTTQLPAALVGGRLDTNTGAWLGSTAPTVGQKTMAASIPVTLASDQPAIPVSTTPSSSTGSAVTQVAGSLVVVTLQALNTARKGLTLYNEGNQAWYVKLGAAASLTSFTVKILRDGYYEVPFGWTGIVTGIQAVSSSSLYVTELT